MTLRGDRENLRRLTSQFDLLHDKLMRVARALSATEEQRHAVLRSIAAQSHPAASASLDRDADRARSNRDRLQSLLAGLDGLVAVPEAPAASAPRLVDSLEEMPESHARLLFAVLLFRDGNLSADAFGDEVMDAFGPKIGGEITRIIVAATGRSPSRAAEM